MARDLPARPPDALALDDTVQQRSWAQLADRTARIARLLREDLGVASGEHVATLMGNRLECIELLLGAIHAGVWLTPINWHLAPEEIAYVVGDSGARVVFSDEEHEPLARAAAPPTILRAGEPLEAAIAAASDAPMPLDGPAGGNMIYTSGTTGRPKGVKRRRPDRLGDVLAAQRPTGRAVGLDGSGAHLVTGPCYHAAPLMFAVYDHANGAPIHILPHWDEAACLAALMEREIAHTHLVPTMFVRLLRHRDETGIDFDAPRLRRVLHGAAPVSPAVKRRMIDWWGPVFDEYWGATESGVITLVDSKTWLEHPETVGRALPAFEVFAVGEDGRPLPPGETGELFARHHSGEPVFEYHGAPEKTADCHLAPDTFSIGDIGRVEPDGFVYLADRQSHTIISGGVNIYPAEIEHVLLEHPAVADVGVFGVPDDEWGESVKAAVELVAGVRPGSELEAEILAWARERIARYKVPRSIDFEEKLPRHASGKLYVRRLRDRYWAGRARRI